MNKYEVMSRDKTSWFIGFGSYNEAAEWYRDYADYICQEGSRLYDVVLIRNKYVKTGINIKFRLFWRDWWEWKPHLELRFGFVFSWLGLIININGEYGYVFDKVVMTKDDLV